MNLYGLIGYPLSHSFSKKYFTEKFEREGLTDHAYELFPIESFSGFDELLHQYPNLKGLNITIPHKQNVLPFLNDRSGIPDELDACNCVKIVKGKTFGFNTDVIGFEKSLAPLLTPLHTNALVLGNGGAAAAVKFVLKKNKINYKVVSRTLHNGSDITYADIDAAVMAKHLLVINTTPLGMYPAIDTCPNLPYEFVGNDHYFFDLVYNPEQTLFLKNAAEQGAITKNGGDMLKIQADESWNIWKRDQPLSTAAKT